MSEFITEHYTLVALIVYALLYVIAIPATRWKRKNKRIGKELKPEVEKIKQKYHAGVVGMDMAHDETLPADIAAMDDTDRATAMSREIHELNAAHGYNSFSRFVDIVFLVLRLAVLIIIGSNIPAGSVHSVTAMGYIYGKGGTILHGVVPGLLVLASAVSSFSLIRELFQSAKSNIDGNTGSNENKSPVKKAIGFVLCLLPFALELWVCTRISFTLSAVLLLNVVADKIISILEKRLGGDTDGEETTEVQNDNQQRM